MPGALWLSPIPTGSFVTPESAFRASPGFDRSSRGLPSGVQSFSMSACQSQLLDLIAEIAGSAPKPADYLGLHAAVLDALS